jgi:hypothetical protein
LQVLKTNINKVAKKMGIHGYLLKANEMLKTHDSFYNNNNFKYGGDRNFLRCVIKKK